MAEEQIQITWEFLLAEAERQDRSIEELEAELVEQTKFVLVGKPSNG